MPNLLRSNYLKGLLFIYFIWALVNIGNLFVIPPSSTDFFSFWYAGQYLRQDVDPYTEFFKDTRTKSVEKDALYVQGSSLFFPIQYLNGVEDTQASLYELSSSKTTVPANTAPLILIITSLSFLSWPLASQIWFFMNIILIFGVSWLTFHYVEQSGLKLSPFIKLLLFLILMGLDATRSSLKQGQTTNLVVFLGLLTLYLVDKDHKLGAGIALGIALSKYNITLPGIFLLLLYKRQFKVVVVAILTQLTGALAISLITKTQIYDIIFSYINLAVFNNSVSDTENVGVNLGAYFEPSIWNTLIFTILFSLIVLGCLLFLLYHQKDKNKPTLSREEVRLTDIHILSILTLLSLLAVRHLKYDMFSIFICLCLFALVTVKPSQWNLTFSTTKWLMAFIGLSIISLSVGFVSSLLLNDTVIGRLVFATQTLSLIIFLVINFWLLRLLLIKRRLKHNNLTEAENGKGSEKIKN